MFTLIYQHPDFIVIHKYANISVHQEHDVSLLQSIAQAIDVERLWLVHRLDKPTSGLLLLACHAQAATQLSKLFSEHQIEKTYWALSDHKPKKKQGWIKGGMAKSRNGAWKLTREYDNFAITHFHSHNLSDGIRLFILQPKTGRTHQLRVAMKSLSAPILGDTLYHGTPSTRLMLHAWRLRFQYQGESFDFSVLPHDWIDVPTCEKIAQTFSNNIK